MFVQQLGTKSMQENCHKTVKCTEHRVSKYKKYGKTYLCSDPNIAQCCKNWTVPWFLRKKLKKIWYIFAL
jgi:hypothetical protein